MKDFLLVFRTDYGTMPQGSPEELQARTQQWMNWMSTIAAQNKLIDRGNRLENSGTVIRPGNVITDGPFMEIKETIGGYTLIKASSMEDAVDIARTCPILQVGGNVEIREIMPL